MTVSRSIDCRPTWFRVRPGLIGLLLLPGPFAADLPSVRPFALAANPPLPASALAAQDAIPSAEAGNRYREAVRACLDNLLAHGTDRYGPVSTPMLMSILDVRVNESPREPLLLDGLVRGEGRPGRRNPAGCDLWGDQPLIGVLLRYSEETGDARYRQAAEAYIRAFLERDRKPNGLLAWGSHLFYNAYTDQIDDDRHGNPHEILIHLAHWDALWRVDPAVTRQEIEGLWTWHIVAKQTGQHNRHDAAAPGCDFAFAGGPLAHAFAFLHAKTGDTLWLDRARLVMNWHWSHRHPQTGLTPDAPSTGDRYDATHGFTTVAGPHALALLRCYELTRDPALLAGVHQWARHIRACFPPAVGRRWREAIFQAMAEARDRGGAYAEGYGRAIDFFVHLHRATRDPQDLATARQLADEALVKLGENGWLKGHAGKPYYEATDGVGILVDDLRAGRFSRPFSPFAGNAVAVATTA